MSQHEREQLGEWLTAYLDGELNDDQRALIERRLDLDVSARRLLEDLRQTAALVKSLPRHPAPSSLAEDVQHHVERSDLLSGLGERRAGRARPGRAVLAFLSMAAVVALLVVGLRLMIGKQPSRPGDTEALLALGPKGTGELGADERGPARGVRPASERTAARSAARLKDGRDTTPAAPGSSDGAGAVSLRRKIDAGLGVESVRQHGFDGETVRLDVTVKDQAECEAVTGQLLADLASRRVGDLDETLRNQPDRAASVGSFYYAGVPMVNFPDPAERQVLVRATHRELDGLLADLAGSLKSDDDVALVAGPLSIHGATPVRAALPYFEEPAPVTGARVDGTKLATADRPRDASALPGSAGVADEADQNVFDGLPRWVGVDPSLLTEVLETGGKSSPDRTSAPTESTPSEVAPSAGCAARGDVKPAAPPEGEAVANRSIGPIRAADSSDKAAEREATDHRTHGEAAPDREPPQTQAGRESGDLESENATLADIEGTDKRDSVVPEEPPSLVARRAKALDEAKRRDVLPPYLALDAGERSMGKGLPEDTTRAAAGKSPTAAPPPPAYVTLVIRVKVAEPNRTDKAATGRDARDRQPGSPAKADRPKTESRERADK